MKIFYTLLLSIISINAISQIRKDHPVYKNGKMEIYYSITISNDTTAKFIFRDLGSESKEQKIFVDFTVRELYKFAKMYAALTDYPVNEDASADITDNLTLRKVKRRYQIHYKNSWTDLGKKDVLLLRNAVYESLNK